MKTASKSFEIRTAKEYLNELVHESYNDFERNHTSTRAAIICAIFAWHLHDWVWAQYKNTLESQLGIREIGDFGNYLLTNCDEFKVIRGVANGSKHFDSDQKDIKSTELQHGFYQGLLGLGTVSHLTVNSEGKTIIFVHAAKTCIQFWDDFFNTILSKQ